MNFSVVLWKKHATDVVDPVLLMTVLFDLGLCFDLG